MPADDGALGKIDHDGALTHALGKLIACRRKRAGLSQLQLANAVGISQSKMSRIEAGTAAPGVFELPRIAAHLGVTPEVLHRETRRLVVNVDAIVEQVTGHEADWSTDATAYDGLIAFVLEHG